MSFLFFLLFLVVPIIGDIFVQGSGLYVEIALVGAVLLCHLRELLRRLPKPPEEEPDGEPGDH